jgi:thioredoxin reductase (NADPH)
MLVRSSSLSKGMSQYLVDQISATENIEVLLNTELHSVLGEQRLEGVQISNRETGKTSQLDMAAVFIFIGAVPHTELLSGLVACNHAGFVLTGPDLIKDGQRPKNWALQRDPYLLETSVPGIFAAGDVRQGAVRRVASAVGEGAIAVSLVHQYLKTV